MAASHKFSQTIALTFSILIFLCLISSLYFYKKQQDVQRAEQFALEQVQRVEEEKQEKAALHDLMNQHLDNFVLELQNQAKSYKQSRKVLKEILAPYNFETPEYTKENYILFKEKIAPDLRNKAEKIINLFQDYSIKLKKDLKNKDNKTQQFFLLKWESTSQEKLNDYINFFEKEEKIIQAYEALIAFYYVHSNLFSVDIERNIFIFERDKDEKQEALLRARIKELKKK